MSIDVSDLFSAGAIAKKLSVSDAKVKKAIKEMDIEPVAKKGVCNYYSPDTVTKVKKSIK